MTAQTPESPVDVIVAAYNDEQGASNALKELKAASEEWKVDIKDAAILKRDMDNKLKITESADRGFGRGAIIGGVAGAAVGVMAGPIGWATLGGAAVGGLAAKLRDGGFKDERLRTIGEGLQPGSSALIVVVEDASLKKAEHVLEERAAEIVTNQVAADVAMLLDAEAARAQQGPAST